MMTGARRTAALAATGILVALLTLRACGRSTDGIDTAHVQEGPFDLTIAETGALQALKSMSYASTIQSNQAKIVALAPEGRMVAKGDLLILFDTTPFEEQIREGEAQASQARAELVKARQDLALQEVQNAEELAAAKQKEEKSGLELQDVEQGEGLLREAEAKAKLAEAERALKRAETARDDLRPLLRAGFITAQEMERAEQEAEKAKEALVIAKRRHDAFFQFGRPLERAQARAEALSTRETSKAMSAAATARLAQKRAALLGAESRVRETEARLQTAREQLARCEVRADVPGIVVYRTVFFGSEQRKPQVGDQVWANQPLLILPDVSRMIVETTVRETDVHRLSAGQKAQVRVAAYPDLRLTGHVTLIGTLAQDDSARRGGKYFGVTVEVDGRDERLRPGMTATVEIAVERRERALFVPVSAVFERGGRRVVYVSNLTGLEEREVVLGSVNRDFAVIERGLARGERVALADPGLGGERP